MRRLEVVGPGSRGGEEEIGRSADQKSARGVSRSATQRPSEGEPRCEGRLGADHPHEEVRRPPREETLEQEILAEDRRTDEQGQRGGGDEGSDEDAKRETGSSTPERLQRQHDEREDEVEAHLCGHAPRLPQPVDVRVRHVDVETESVEQPGPGLGAGRKGHDEQRDPVGRQDPRSATNEVGPCPEPPRGVQLGDQPAVQQEPGEREEDGYADIAACQHVPHDTGRGTNPGEEGRMG